MTFRAKVTKNKLYAKPENWVWSKMGVAASEKIEDRSSLVSKGPKYHIP